MAKERKEAKPGSYAFPEETQRNRALSLYKEGAEDRFAVVRIDKPSVPIRSILKIRVLLLAQSVSRKGAKARKEVKPST